MNLTRPQVTVADGGSGGVGGKPDGGDGPGAEAPDAPGLDVGGAEARDSVPDDDGETGGEGDAVATEVSREAGIGAAGSPCDEDGDCASDFCTDRVCCDSRCGSQCHACNLPGKEGACTVVTAGEDPRHECDQHPEAGCGQDGTCNGAGACALYASGRQCAAATCAGSTETAASTCDGKGQCQPGTSRTCPGGLSCMGSSCATTCTSDAACGSGFFCEAGTCRAKRARGLACTAPGQCQSGFCSDNVCCGTACTDLCQVCNLPAALGTCSAVPAGSDPRGVCEPQPAACQRDGSCDGRGACRLQVPGTSCGAQSCSGSVLSPAATCDGVGTCRAATPQSCGAYLCSGTGCGTSCSGNQQCNVGYTCSAGSCVALPGPVLHWKFDEAAGSVTAADSSGNGNNGSYTGSSGMPAASVMVAPGISPNPFSRSFLRSNRHGVRLRSMPAIIKPARVFTITVWYRSTSLDTGSPPLAGEELVSGGDSYLVRVRSADIEFSRAFTTSSGGLNFDRCFMTVANRLDGNWHHVVAVVDNDEMRGYFDGVLACTTATNSSATRYDRGSDFFVGNHGFGGDNYDFEGNIDDVRFYTRALSAAEAAAIAAGRL